MEELGSILFLGDKESMRWQLWMGEFRRAGVKMLETLLGCLNDVLLCCSLLLLVTVLSHSHTHPFTHSVSSLNHNLLFANCLLSRLSNFIQLRSSQLSRFRWVLAKNFGSNDDSGEGRNTWG